MTRNYALIKDGLVENVFVCDNDETALAIFPDATVIDTGDTGAGIGWSYADSTFTAPPVPELSQAEKVASAEQEKAALLDTATAKIVVWQTKLLVGRKLSDSETTQLNAWLDYIDEVTAVDTSNAPDITWPALASGGE